MGKTFLDEIFIAEQSSSPGNPPAGFQSFYPKTDGKFYSKTSSGVETDLTAGGAGGSSTWTTVKKVANETKTANTTLANDNTLVVALSASTTYRIYIMVMLTTANATMDYKYALGFSGTTNSIHVKRKHITAGAAAGTDNETIGVQSTILGSTAVAATTTGLATVELNIIIDVNAAGTLGFQWAQNTSDPGALIVLKGSYLERMTI